MSDDPPIEGSDVRRVRVREELIFLVFLVAALTAIALVIVAVSNVALSRALPLSFVIGGAAVVIGGFLEAVNKMPYWYTPSQRREAFRMSYVYATLGVLLVVAGVVLDVVLS